MKRALVTGGAGFIGSHLCARLVRDGFHVTAVDDMSLGHPRQLESVLGHERFTLIECSVLDHEFLQIAADGAFAAIFHLAANSDIALGTRDRSVDLERTFRTTCAACEAAVQGGIPELLFASSSAVFGDAGQILVEEGGPLRPVSFYGAAKLASEAYLSAYAHRFGVRTWVFRFPNVVGPRATHGVILDFIRKLEKTPELLNVLGNGQQIKPYLHVHDLIEAMMFAWCVKDAEPLSVYHIGGETRTSVQKIAEIVAYAMGGTPEIRYERTAAGWPGDVPAFAYDGSRIRALGWRPRHSSDEAIQTSVTALLEERRCKR